MSPEELAQAHKLVREFHAVYERLAPEYHFNSKRVISWEEIPKQEKLLLVGIFADMLDKGIIKV